jgi:amidase
MSIPNPSVDELHQLARRARITIERDEVEALHSSVIDALAGLDPVDSYPVRRNTNRDGPDRHGADPSPGVASQSGTDSAAVDGRRAATEGADSEHWRYRFRIGSGLGPLAGRTVVVKDCVAIAGIPMTLGLAGVRYRPRHDAAIVTELLTAGASVIGTSTCEALCLSGGSHTAITGPVGNPTDSRRSSGGSSSGSAVLVASGEVDLGVGTDQAGSVRIPSAWCGIYGLKPTHDAIPYDGVFSMHPRLDHVGLMARDAARLADAWSALRPPPHSEADESGPVRRVALVREGFGRAESQGDVDDHVRRLADQLIALGIAVDEVSVPLHTDAPAAVAALSLAGLAGLLHGDNDDEVGPLAALGSVVRASVRRGPRPATVTASVLTALYANTIGPGRRMDRAVDLADDMTAAADEVFDRFDALLLPTTPMRAPLLPEHDASPSETVRLSYHASGNTSPFNLTGHPAITVPCRVDGLPVGAMFAARRGGEDLLLRIAQLLASAPI